MKIILRMLNYHLLQHAIFADLEVYADTLWAGENASDWGWP